MMEVAQLLQSDNPEIIRRIEAASGIPTAGFFTNDRSPRRKSRFGADHRSRTVRKMGRGTLEKTFP
jgi:hypothetical protein